MLSRTALASAGLIVASALIGGQGCPSVLVPAPFNPNAVGVGIRDSTFVPVVTTISAGQTVRWINQDFLFAHTVTSGQPNHADAGALFDSNVLQSGEFFDREFLLPGTYEYFCQIHPNLERGVIVVQ